MKGSLSINTILTAGATPVLIDCDPFTYTINPLEVERMLQRRSNGNGSAAHADATAGNEQRSGGGTTVLLADHLFGQPCEMRTLTQLADAHGLTLIEVAWEAFGARYDGRQVGHSGTAVFSFLEGMAINTAEGGMLTTNDARLAELVRVYANNGCDDDGRIVVPGFNYRMPYGTACVATEQLKLARRYSRPRHHNARELTHLLSDIRGVVPPMSLPGAEHAYQRYAVRLAREFPFSVEETRDRLRAREIWASCCELQSPYAHPYFREGNLSCGPLPETEAACRELLFIRLADQVEHEELVRIANELKTLSTGSAPQSH